MEMRLIKENLMMEQPLPPTSGQAVVEGEMNLPGGLREEARVLHAGAMAAVEKIEPMQDRASVMGRVTFHALFTQGDPTRVQALEATADFTHLTDLPGAQPRSRCRAVCTVEHVEASAAGGRLTMKAVLRLQLSGVNAQPMEVVTGVADVENVQCRTQVAELRRTVASGDGETLLREEFALPDELRIRETFYATAQSRITGVTGGYGRAGVSGQISLEAVHGSDLPGHPVVITRHTLPFEHPVDMVGEEGEELQASVWVKDVAAASQETAPGERTLRAEVLLGMKGWADRQEKVTLLTDAYTISGDVLCPSAQGVCLKTGESSFRAAESGKTLLLLPGGSPAVKQVLCAFATPVMAGHEQMGGRVAVQGVMEVTLLYMTDEDPAPVSVSLEEPFRMTFTAQCGEEDEIALEVQDVDAVAVTGDRVEMKYVMHLSSTGVRTAQARPVTDVSTAQAPMPDSSIVLYFVQPGESLWDIAKRYRVPVGEIQDLNPELKGEPLPGQGIVVWRRA